MYYVKEPCALTDVEAKVFLHLVPADEKDLPSSAQYYFHNLDFNVKAHAANGGGKCIAVRQLPAYPIKRIRTGQYVPARAASGR